MRALLLSGGGPRGRVQLDAIRRVRAEGPVDLVVATSVGGANMLPVATGRAQDVADTMWSRITKRRDIMRIRDLNPMDGIYSLSPYIQMIEAAGLFDGFEIPSFVGVVDGVTGRHRFVRVDTLTKPDRQDAVRCTASIVPFPHEIARFQGRVTTDGGERRVLAGLPPAWIGRVREVHAVFCSPTSRAGRRVHRTQGDVSTMLGLIAAKIDDQVTKNIYNDLARLRRYAAAGIRVFVYAPQSFADVGATWDITEAMRERRAQTSIWMGAHRVLLRAS